METLFHPSEVVSPKTLSSTSLNVFDFNLHNRYLFFFLLQSCWIHCLSMIYHPFLLIHTGFGKKCYSLNLFLLLLSRTDTVVNNRNELKKYRSILCLTNGITFRVYCTVFSLNFRPFLYNSVYLVSRRDVVHEEWERRARVQEPLS